MATGAAGWGGGGTTSALSAAAMGWDGFPVGSGRGLMVSGDGVAANEAPMTDEELRCGVATIATKWGGSDTPAACDNAAVGRSR